MSTAQQRHVKHLAKQHRSHQARIQKYSESTRADRAAAEAAWRAAGRRNIFTAKGQGLARFSQKAAS